MPLTLSVNEQQVGFEEYLEKSFGGGIKNIDCCVVTFCCLTLPPSLRLRVTAMINTHEGNCSCCDLCSALCGGHLYIVKHVTEQLPPLSSQSFRQPGCKDAADKHSFR